MDKKPLYKRIAGLTMAYKTCIMTNNTEWEAKHEEHINELVKDNMPYGSGIDSGTTFDIEGSSHTKLIFNSSYHYMNENGYYDGWIDFTVKVYASLQFDFNLSITGKFGKHQNLKDYLYDVFDTALRINV